MANDVLRLWEAIEPMAKASIERQTRDTVRMKQMVVTVPYNSTTKTIGVCEPFGKTVQLPVYGGMDASELETGTAVWVLSPYSSFSNAMVYMIGDGTTGIGSVSALESRLSALELAVSHFWETIYPVGSLYISVASTPPSTLFGGTWVQIEDTFLIAAGQNYTVGDTGGESTHTLSEEELPSISGSFRIRQIGSTDWGVIMGPSGKFSTATSTANPAIRFADAGSSSTGVPQQVTYAFGSGQAHNNLPPYLAVNVWKRTA